MKKRLFRFLIGLTPMLGLLSACSTCRTLPAWKDGYLDIHFISTGRGECAYYVFPDGTTLVIDAGEVETPNPKHPHVHPRPDSLTRTTDAYARYIRRFMPRVCRDSLDYMLLTHFHIDHMGALEQRFTRDPEGGYILSGITALNDKLPFRCVIDRSWPDYDPASDPLFGKRTVKNWARFMKYGVAHQRFKAQKFMLGSSSQIALRHAPDKYPDFKVLNMAVDGRYWDGEKCVDPYDRAAVGPRENANSCAILLSYGDFDWYAGGDLHDLTVELPLARSIGRKVEAMKAGHHMAWNTMDTLTLAVLQPRVIVCPAFTDHKPWVKVLRENIFSDAGYAGPRSLYITSTHPRILKEMPELAEKAASLNGHVVIRVLPGGKEYYVYVLDDCDPRYRVLHRDGPFPCE